MVARMINKHVPFCQSFNSRIHFVKLKFPAIKTHSLSILLHPDRKYHNIQFPHDFHKLCSHTISSFDTFVCWHINNLFALSVNNDCFNPPLKIKQFLSTPYIRNTFKCEFAFWVSFQVCLDFLIRISQCEPGNGKSWENHCEIDMI